MNDDGVNKTRKLAEKVLGFSRDNLLVSLRFLQRALAQIHPYPIGRGYTVGTNGDYLFYNDDYVLESYKQEENAVTRTYLHMIFHGILGHIFNREFEDGRLWNLAADIAVENSIMFLPLKAVETSRDREQLKVINDLSKHVDMTAEKLYKYLQGGNLSLEDLDYYGRLFIRDDHMFWRIDPNRNPPHDLAQYEFIKENDEADPNEETREEEWKKISERVKVDLETFSSEYGDEAGVLMQNIREVHRERYDYGEFLKQFAVLSEEMQTNDDEFDYGFYTYGMELYGNLPLIEPLEYKEVSKVRDFVIAIDTSGSCSGELVQAFLNHTYTIMKSTENFFKKVNIHIIQSDAKVQQDTKITSDKEFEEFMDSLVLFGFGGTDFRPVFRYVEELIEEGEFDNLKGLIYFTDGYGKFPEWRPDYQVAFVFLDENYDEKRVPPLLLLKSSSDPW